MPGLSLVSSIGKHQPKPAVPRGGPRSPALISRRPRSRCLCWKAELSATERPPDCAVAEPWCLLLMVSHWVLDPPFAAVAMGVRAACEPPCQRLAGVKPRDKVGAHPLENPSRLLETGRGHLRSSYPGGSAWEADGPAPRGRGAEPPPPRSPPPALSRGRGGAPPAELHPAAARGRTGPSRPPPRARPPPSGAEGCGGSARHGAARGRAVPGVPPLGRPRRGLGVAPQRPPRP